MRVGCQASGAAPFLRGRSVDEPETIATAIRIGCPQSWALANQAQEESLGWFRESLDEDILIAQKILAEREGIFCEPASAVCIAGLIAELDRQTIPSGATIVCTLTGHGLKDPDTAVSQSRQPIKVSPNLTAVRGVVLDELD